MYCVGNNGVLYAAHQIQPTRHVYSEYFMKTTLLLYRPPTRVYYPALSVIILTQFRTSSLHRHWLHRVPLR